MGTKPGRKPEIPEVIKLIKQTLRRDSTQDPLKLYMQIRGVTSEEASRRVLLKYGVVHSAFLEHDNIPWQLNAELSNHPVLQSVRALNRYEAGYKVRPERIIKRALALRQALVDAGKVLDYRPDIEHARWPLAFAKCYPFFPVDREKPDGVEILRLPRIDEVPRYPLKRRCRWVSPSPEPDEV